MTGPTKYEPAVIEREVIEREREREREGGGDGGGGGGVGGEE